MTGGRPARSIKSHWSQNLVTPNISPDDLAAIAAAITTLQEKLGGLIEFSVEQRRSLAKMGDKSEAFCRQTLIVLAQNRQIIPPELDLAEAERDLHKLDLLRPHLASLRQLVGKADDTEIALGSDILTAALEAYALAKVFGNGAGRRPADYHREVSARRTGHPWSSSAQLLHRRLLKKGSFSENRKQSTLR
ncbi:hypothetical protein E4Q23_06540 [Candidatus Accumulibacter phosphatis]|uniref:Uncharacterized protein n=1 Tax=Candidatus Accumulibacter phosphatis TaxID=327160 RepID=A0ABX1TWJ2_9PROT|nr:MULTISPECIES: hypothetical protein [Candidatus Accumulibacter]NMQ27444.1 hypothetical protein [Candidatus Accumulibacter phosphatis]